MSFFIKLRFLLLLFFVLFQVSCVKISDNPKVTLTANEYAQQVQGIGQITWMWSVARIKGEYKRSDENVFGTKCIVLNAGKATALGKTLAQWNINCFLSDKEFAAKGYLFKGSAKSNAAKKVTIRGILDGVLEGSHEVSLDPCTIESITPLKKKHL